MKIFFFILLTAVISYSQTGTGNPVPVNSLQMVLVLTDSVQSVKGFLVRYERENEKSGWEKVGNNLPVVLGRNGLGWGRGLNPIDSTTLPLKHEGDGRSPAGIFTLTAAFGYAPAEEMKNLKITYIPITELMECVDDIESQYYNQLRIKDSSADWKSSERMFYSDPWYRQGVIVDQNSSPAIKGSGSCIFLHNWASPDETTSGCTELEPAKMTELVEWLDISKKPILVQLTRELYNRYNGSWQLPEVAK